MNEIIRNDMRNCFGLEAMSVLPVSGGWLNLKWKVETDRGTVLVKQYSHERFSPRKLRDIEDALHRQIAVREAGVPCPRIWRKDGGILRRPSEEVSYMIMDFVPGRIGTPETIDNAQMESLGDACARMHRAFSQLPVGGVKGYPPVRGGVMKALRGVFDGKAHPEDAPQALRETVARLAPVVSRIPEELPDRLPCALAHEDFTGDNMLFGDDRLSAIIDFDRNQYGFPLHDVGRVLLSLALGDGGMNEGLVRSFMAGYTAWLPLTPEQVTDALLLTFAIEAPWWLQRGCFESPSPKTSRFVKEIRWLGEAILSGKLPGMRWQAACVRRICRKSDQILHNRLELPQSFS